MHHKEIFQAALAHLKIADGCAVQFYPWWGSVEEGGGIKEEVTKSCQKENESVFLTETVAMCIPLKAHSTLGFRVASERALCIHTLKAGSTVMALLRTLVDVWDRPGWEKKKIHAMSHYATGWQCGLKVRLQNASYSSLYSKEEKKKERKRVRREHEGRKCLFPRH